MVWAITIIGILLGLALLIILVGYVAYSMVLIRQKEKRHVQNFNDEETQRQSEISNTMREEGRAWFDTKGAQDVSLQSRDGLKLCGWYLPAPKPSNKMVVFSHGFTNHGLGEFPPFFKFYSEELNFHLLIPDHRSHGRSEGKYIGFSGLEWQDILDWADSFVGHLGSDPQVVLHGMSMGAATVMNCNVHNPPDYVKFIIEDCGFTNGFEIQWLCAKRDLKMPKFLLPVMWATGMWYKVFTGKSLRKDCDPYGNIEKFSKPTLFVSGEGDPFVPAEMSIRCHGAATVPKELFLVPDAKHCMAYYLDQEGYQEKLRAWVSKWITEDVAATA